jgi:hypothetical protein
MLPQLGWQCQGQPLPLADCTARQRTDLQLGPCGSGGASTTWNPMQPGQWVGQWVPADEPLGLLCRLWLLRSENRHKELALLAAGALCSCPLQAAVLLGSHCCLLPHL